MSHEPVDFGGKAPKPVDVPIIDHLEQSIENR